MGDYSNIMTSDFIALMRKYLDGEVDAAIYTENFFYLMKRFSTSRDDEFQVLQSAFTDADDYDPTVRLDFTIEEPELKKRVARSLEALLILANDQSER